MITVNKVFCTYNDTLPFYYDKEKNMYYANTKFTIMIACTRNRKKGDLYLDVDEGCPYNGTSVPIEVGFLKNYYAKAKKDIPGLLHDALYSWGGEVECTEPFEPGECDDVFRGSLREAGFTRFEAGAMDRAVRTFAHARHFGKKNDSEGMHLKCKFHWIPIE